MKDTSKHHILPFGNALDAWEPRAKLCQVCNLPELITPFEQLHNICYKCAEQNTNEGKITIEGGGRIAIGEDDE